MGERPLDMLLAEGDALPGHRRLDCNGNTRSRTKPSSFFGMKKQKMIGGDLVLEKVSSNPLIEPPLDPAKGRPRSLLQYNESLKRLLTLPVDIIYTGHGNEVRNVHALIESRLVKQRERALKVLAMMDDGSRTIFELTRELFPAVYEKELGLTLSETIGQTDYLVDEGLARETRDEGGILHYEQA